MPATARISRHIRCAMSGLCGRRDDRLARDRRYGTSGEKWPCASAAGNVKAGNDITMPGIPSDKIDMLKGLEDPTHPYALSRAELQLSAKRVLEMILKLA